MERPSFSVDCLRRHASVSRMDGLITKGQFDRSRLLEAPSANGGTASLDYQREKQIRWHVALRAEAAEDRCRPLVFDRVCFLRAEVLPRAHADLRAVRQRGLCLRLQEVQEVLLHRMCQTVRAASNWRDKSRQVQGVNGRCSSCIKLNHLWGFKNSRMKRCNKNSHPLVSSRSRRVMVLDLFHISESSCKKLSCNFFFYSFCLLMVF